MFLSRPRLFLPPGAVLWSEWGIDEDRLGSRWISARYQLTIQVNGGEPRMLLDFTMTSDSEPKWRGRTIQLTGLGSQRVKMCVRAEAEGDMDKLLKAVAWANPLITSPAQRSALAIGAHRLTKQAGANAPRAAA